MKIRTIIVDDEALARRGIELRLESHSDFQIVAQCENGREAVDTIAREQPDLMFLDIQMPGYSGLDVLAHVPQESMPIVVFITAFDRYALNAFEAQALDYLLKPINERRFEACLERVRAVWLQRAAATQREQLMRLLGAYGKGAIIDLHALNDQLQTNEARYPEFLLIRDDAGTERVPVATVDWIDAAGDYMCIHAAGRTYVLRETMKALEGMLDPQLFQRVHRSTIVNMKRVRRLRPHTNGEYFLTLLDGQEIKLSRSYRDRVDRLLR